jgi:hypothetical protein
VICRRCNETKGPLTHEELSALLAVLRDFASAARVDVLRLQAGGRVGR